MERTQRALLPVLTSEFWGWKGVWGLAAPPCSAQLYSHKLRLLLCSAPAVTSERVTQATHPRTLCSACLVTAPTCSRRPKEQTTNGSMRVAMETTCLHRSNEQALATLVHVMHPRLPAPWITHQLRCTTAHLPPRADGALPLRPLLYQTL